jgi:hypothetical protein
MTATRTVDFIVMQHLTYRPFHVEALQAVNKAIHPPRAARNWLSVPLAVRPQDLKFRLCVSSLTASSLTHELLPCSFQRSQFTLMRRIP